MSHSARAARFPRLVVLAALLFALFAPTLPAAAAPPARSEVAPLVAPVPSAPNAAPAEAASAPLSAVVTPTPTEVPSLRTRTSDTYVTARGYSTQVFAGSINYQDANKIWQPIDNTLVTTAASGYAYQNKANSYTALFPSTLAAAPIKVSRGGASVSFSLTGATGTLTTTANTATYANALPGVTVVYTANNDDVGEALVLSGPSAPRRFVYSLQVSPGLTAQANGAGGIDVVDGARAVQLSFASPFKVDAAGASPGSAAAVGLALTQVGSVQTVTVDADVAWLASAARVWPVTIDPSTSVTPTRNCRIANGSLATTTACSPDTLYVGYNGSNVYRSLLQFSVAAIPSNATILDAQLQLYLKGSSGSGSATVNAMQLTQAWASGVTWNTTDGTTAWTVAGGTFGATPLYSTTMGALNQRYAWGVTAAVQRWVNGADANDGVLLKTANEAVANRWRFTPAGETHAPTLEVTWEPWLGELGFWTDYAHPLTDRSRLLVNVANGNLILHADDLAITGTGLPLSFQREFNNLTSHTYDIGHHWALGLGQAFHLDTSGLNGVALYGPSGFAVLFAANGSGGFSHPAGVEASLVKSGDGTYTLTWNANGTKDNFAVPNGNGVARLKTIVDRNGNTITLTSNAGGHVTSVTDTQQRVVTYHYNADDMITRITDSTGREVKYGYDADLNLTDYWDAANKHTTYDYTSRNLTRITDALGNQTRLTYNASDTVATIVYVTNNTLGTGPTVSFTYNTGNTVVTDPNANGTSFYFDLFGRITKVTDAQSNTQQTSYNADNQVLTQTDAYSHVTTNTYDANDNLTKIQFPAAQLATGASESWSYTDATHPFYPTTFTDAQGNVTTNTYDTPGNLHTITDQLATQNSSTISWQRRTARRSTTTPTARSRRWWTSTATRPATPTTR